MLNRFDLARKYLRERGITEETIRAHGIEIDTRMSQKQARERLGRGLPEGTIECLWFPVFDAASVVTSWIARPLPKIEGQPKFVCPIDSDGAPYIPKGVYGAAPGRPVIITEGPVRALLAKQAGFDAIGLNGVWGAGTRNSRDQIVLRADLYSALDWRGRKAYLCFDADCAIKPEVLPALFPFAVRRGGGLSTDYLGYQPRQRN